ncbi:MAG: DUF1731 domain-containing protein [Planctomycetota bacterium]
MIRSLPARVRWSFRFTDLIAKLALYGRYVVPQRLLASGFEFQYPDLNDALADV